MDWFNEQYLGGSGVDADRPAGLAAAGRICSGLPPALIATAGFDPLRDEGDSYAAALRAAGTPSTCARWDR